MLMAGIRSNKKAGDILGGAITFAISEPGILNGLPV